MPDKHQLMSLREYARHRGVTLHAVQKAIQTERIEVVLHAGKQMIAPDEADLLWKAETRPRVDYEAGKEGSVYRRSRSQKEYYQAKMARLEYRQQVGQVLNAQDVRARIAKLVGETRERLLNLPDKIGPVVVGQSNLHEVVVLLRAEIQEALESLSKL